MPVDAILKENLLIVIYLYLIYHTILCSFFSNEGVRKPRQVELFTCLVILFNSLFFNDEVTNSSKLIGFDNASLISY